MYCFVVLVFDVSTIASNVLAALITVKYNAQSLDDVQVVKTILSCMHVYDGKLSSQEKHMRRLNTPGNL